MSDNKFWLNNISTLFLKNNYKQFIPTSGMNEIERLNAIARFAIYFLILSVLMKKDDIWIMMGVFILIMTVVMYSGKQPNITNDIDISNSEIELFDGKEKSTTIEDTDDTIPVKNTDNKKSCRLPTVDNPFMNPSINDLNTDYPSACNVDDDDIKSQMTMNYNESMFMNIDDLFDVKNSQRQFYTIPSNVPPRQKEFAEWCYSGKNNCKLNQENCLRYEDLRYAKDQHSNTPSSQPSYR